MAASSSSSGANVRFDLTQWAGAKRMGGPVTGFIPFKCPIDDLEGATVLQSGNDDFDPEEHSFSVSMFMERQASDGNVVGLVIDLTTPQPSGKALYDTEEWARDWDVDYVSLPCAPPIAEVGQGESVSSSSSSLWTEPVPSEEAVHKFIVAVGRFWSQPANQRRHVAVHCVTGVNVAGYMIARFLARNAPIGKVLAAFSKSRSPGIYSPDLLEALWRASAPPTPAAKAAKSDGGWVQPAPPSWHPLQFRAIDRTSGAAPPAAAGSMGPPAAMGAPATMPPPPKPSLPAVPLFAAAGTKRPAQDDADAASEKTASSSGMLPPPPKRAPPKSGPSGCSNIGTLLSETEAARLRAKCEQLVVGGTAASAVPPRLPCFSHGRALGASNLEAMRAGADGWLVTWKADGERCLCLVEHGQGGAGDAGVSTSRTVLINEQGAAYQLGPMQWPRKPAPAENAGAPDAAGAPAPPGMRPHDGLIIAGELVCDRESAGAPPVWRLLCYDLLALDGKPVASLPLHKRMALLGAEVLAPRKGNPSVAAAVASESMRVRQKDCFRLKHTSHLLRKFIPKLTHPSKGLVFLASGAPFAPGPEASTALDWYRQPSSGVAEGGAVPEADLLAFADAHFG